jgi:putative ATPase
MREPLAERLRPETLDDVVGQSHILGKSGVLRRIVQSGLLPNLIFYGPSGTGKSTVSAILARETGRRLCKLNATTASLADVKEIIESLDTMLAPNGVLLYLDEIQYFNKKQQQSLLEYMENGKITLIASTTENPYFAIYNAILSRATVFEFKPLEPKDVELAVKRAVTLLDEEVDCPQDVIEHIAVSCGGDVRKALTALELLTAAADRKGGRAILTMEDAKQVTQRSAMRFDRDGDSHYDVLSAFQKSMRGSDPDAAVHYLARLLAGGDLVSACRRLLVTACEDVGLAYPQCITIVKACVDTAVQLGIPEAMMPLSQAVILVATSPKSNSASGAIGKALSDVHAGKGGDVPLHLKDSSYKGAAKMGRGTEYKYAHSFENNYVKQQYLPDVLKGKEYYKYGENKVEQAAKKYWDEVKK